MKVLFNYNNQVDSVIMDCSYDSCVGDKGWFVVLFTTTLTTKDKDLFGRTAPYSA